MSASPPQPWLAIGVGCRRNCPPEAILELVASALAHAASPARIVLFAPELKRNEAGLAEAALRLGAPLRFLPLADLRAAAPRALSHSAQTMQRFGVPSIAETAALAGAGPEARLLAPRLTNARAACAIAFFSS